MFPSTSSRETLRLSGKQNSLFPSGAHIKCIVLPFYLKSIFILNTTFHVVLTIELAFQSDNL